MDYSSEIQWWNVITKKYNCGIQDIYEKEKYVFKCLKNTKSIEKICNIPTYNFTVVAVAVLGSKEKLYIICYY